MLEFREGDPRNKSQDIEPLPKSQFIEMLEARCISANSYVWFGLDTDYERVPEIVKRRLFPNSGLYLHGSLITRSLSSFNIEIIGATHDLVGAYKINPAPYLAFGHDGFNALEITTKYIKENHSDIPLILDVKNDTPNSAEYYARMAFDLLNADAVTVNPYMGKDAVSPFLKRKEKGVFVLVKTSNPGSDEFQGLSWKDGLRRPENKRYLYEVVAEHVRFQWNENGNVGMVVGATYPHELESVRKIARDMPILIPGVGEQEGDLEKSIKAGRDSSGQGFLAGSSRSFIYASDKIDFAQAARRKAEGLREEINLYRRAV